MPPDKEAGQQAGDKTEGQARHGADDESGKGAADAGAVKIGADNDVLLVWTAPDGIKRARMRSL